jgi:outer membrane lipoprotein
MIRKDIGASGPHIGAAARLLVLAVLVSGGCTSYQVIPAPLKDQVNRNVAFSDIKGSPDSYHGQLVVLGGEVQGATRLANQTRVEVLQLPLSKDLIPMTEKEVQSQGRFYAIDDQGKRMDPAVLAKGTPITIVGAVVGSKAGKLDESTYEYPVVEIRDLTKWEKNEASRWPYYGYPYYGGYYWYGMRPYGFYW